MAENDDSAGSPAPKHTRFQQALIRWIEAYRAYADDETDDASICDAEQAAEDALMAIPATSAVEFATKLCIFTRWGAFALEDESPVLMEALQLSDLHPDLSGTPAALNMVGAQ